MPVLIILGSFACLVGFVAFGALAVDSANIGRRVSAFIFVTLAALCVLGMNACMDALDRALAERMGSAE